MAALHVKNPEANDWAEELAVRGGMTKTAAAKLALRSELDRGASAGRQPLRERMIEFWSRCPLPDTLGPAPDKAFYDDLFGDL